MGEYQRVLELLDELAGLLATSPITPAVVEQIDQAAEQLDQALVYHDLLPMPTAEFAQRLQDPRLSVFGDGARLAAVGGALSSLSGQLLRPGGQHGAETMPLPLLGLLCGCTAKVASGCMLVGAALGPQLSRNNGLRLSTGLDVVLAIGRALLQRYLRAMPAGLPADQAFPSVPPAALRQMALSGATDQLAALFSSLRVLQAQPELEAAWGRTTGRPEAVLPLLSAAAAVVREAGAVADHTNTFVLGIHSNLAGACNELFCGRRFPAHKTALAADGDTQAALFGLLLEGALPCAVSALEAAVQLRGGSGTGGGGTGGGGSGRAYLGPGSGLAASAGDEPDIPHLEAMGLSTVRHFPFELLAAAAEADSPARPAALRCARRAGGGAQLVRLASRAVLALPQRPQDSSWLEVWAETQAAAARLVALTAFLSQGTADAAGAGGGASASARNRAAARERDEVSLALLQLLPRSVAVLHGMAADSRCTVAHLAFTAESAARCVGHVTLAAEAAQQQQGQPERALGPEAAAAWVAALDAALSLLPLAEQQLPAWRRLRQPGLDMAPRLHCTLLIQFLPRGMGMLEATARSRPLPALRAQLWGLHAKACRALHWLTLPEHMQQTSLLPGMQSLTSMVLVQRYTQGLHPLFLAAHEELARGGREWQHAAGAACGAHFAALAAARPLLIPQFGEGCNWLGLAGCQAVAVIAGSGSFPAASDPAFVELVGQMLEPRLNRLEGRGRNWPATFLQSLTDVLDSGRLPARLLAGLAASEVLDSLIQQDEVLPLDPAGRAANVHMAADTLRLGLARLRFFFCLKALMALERAAAELPAGQLQPAALRQLSAALDGLPRPSGSRTARQNAEMGDAMVAGLLRAVPPGQQVAQQLLQLWSAPEQVASDRLAAARAAAARSCAYLGCANLGLEGGPAVGEGRGCKRCSKCRVAYYCGTACSHADWRAGHRRVCAALGAARQGGGDGGSG